jgi:RNA polymerase sigma-70 factor (ECF subfamily)
MMAQSDETIVSSVQNGQTEAFEVLVDRYKDTVYGMIMRMTGDPQVAEDLAQDTFIRAYRGLSTFRSESRFSTWLVQIAVNLVRDHIRRRRRNRETSLDAMLERDEDAAIFIDKASWRDPLEEISERDLMKRFESALKGIPPNYREVFVLHHIQNMSYEDIAAFTGDSVGSLKVRAHRARKLLKEMIFPEEKQLTPNDVVD